MEVCHLVSDPIQGDQKISDQLCDQLMDDYSYDYWARIYFEAFQTGI